jgi:hypothetical protein
MEIVFITGGEITNIECDWPVIPRIGESVNISGEFYKVTNICYNDSYKNTGKDTFDLHKILVYLKST